MKYSELVESGASIPEIQSYLVDSELVTVTLWLPGTMFDLVKDHAALKGFNFTSLVNNV